MDLTHSGASDVWRHVGQGVDFKQRVTVLDRFSGDLLHTGVIVSTSSTFEWPVTSFLGLQREETRSNCGFRQKKKKKKKKKLYGGKRWCSPEKEAIRWL